MKGVVMTPRCTRSRTARSRSGLCGALRLVALVQVGPGARLRAAKSFMDVVRLVIGSLDLSFQKQLHIFLEYICESFLYRPSPDLFNIDCMISGNQYRLFKALPVF